MPVRPARYREEAVAEGTALGQVEQEELAVVARSSFGNMARDVNAKIDIFGPWAGLVLPPGI